MYILMKKKKSIVKIILSANWNSLWKIIFNELKAEKLLQVLNILSANNNDYFAFSKSTYPILDIVLEIG